MLVQSTAIVTAHVDHNTFDTVALSLSERHVDNNSVNNLRTVTLNLFCMYLYRNLYATPQKKYREN